MKNHKILSPYFEAGVKHEDFNNVHLISWPSSSLQEDIRHAQALLLLGQSSAQILRYKQALKNQKNKNSKARIDSCIKALEQKHNEYKKSLEYFNTRELNQEWLNLIQSMPNPVFSLEKYAANIFRDWSSDEIDQQVSALQKLAPLEDYNDTLVLGSGFGRLAYELARKLSGNCFAMDINPWMQFSANRIIKSEFKEFYEMSLFSYKAEDQTKLHKFSLPKQKIDNLFFVLGDFFDDITKEKAFDTLVCPWFLDILPQEPEYVINRFNYALKENGQLIFCGPLSFAQQNIENQLGFEELKDVLSDQGFEVTDSFVQTEKYLNSDIQAQARTEKVLYFKARKIKNIKKLEKKTTYPDFLVDSKINIPLHHSWEKHKVLHRLYLEILYTIDGEVNLEQLSQAVAINYNMQEKDAKAALSLFILQLWQSELQARA